MKRYDIDLLEGTPYQPWPMRPDSDGDWVKFEEVSKEIEIAKAECAQLHEQIDGLAKVIMAEVPGEPSRSEGACECAIRLIRAAYSVKP